MQLKQNFHADDRCWHLVGLVVQKGVNIPLVVANQGNPQVRDKGRCFLHEETREDQGAEHLGSGHALLGASFVERPGVRICLDLVAEPEDVLFRGGLQLVSHPPNIRQAMTPRVQTKGQAVPKFLLKQ